MNTSPNQIFGKVAVLMGGISAEREVSLRSGAAVLTALCRQGIDAHAVDANPQNIGHLQDHDFTRVFNILHGRWGEDGVVQGALEAIGMPYTGSGVLGCALAMDKVRSKQIWQALALPTAKYRVLRSEQDLDGLIEAIGLPLFLKPSHEGSSVGVGKVSSSDQLLATYQRSAAVGDEVLAEEFLAGSELTVAILDNQALPVVRMSASNEFYDYAAKYESDETQYFCPAGLNEALEHQVRDLAKSAFLSLGCRSWGRVDVMLDERGAPMLLEVNPIPGMTDHSLVPMAAAAAGLNFDDLVVRILEGSL
jgi:D-alanine-D-alanine ligase